MWEMMAGAVVAASYAAHEQRRQYQGVKSACAPFLSAAEASPSAKPIAVCPEVVVNETLRSAKRGTYLLLAVIVSGCALVARVFGVL